MAKALSTVTTGGHDDPSTSLVSRPNDDVAIIGERLKKGALLSTKVGIVVTRVPSKKGSSSHRENPTRQPPNSRGNQTPRRPSSRSEEPKTVTGARSVTVQSVAPLKPPHEIDHGSVQEPMITTIRSRDKLGWVLEEGEKKWAGGHFQREVEHCIQSVGRRPRKV